MKKRWLVVVFVMALLVGCSTKNSSVGQYYVEDVYTSAEAKESYSPNESYDEVEDVNSLVVDMQEKKMVYSGYLYIQSLEYKETISYIEQKIKEFGGFLESQEESDSNRGWYQNDEEGYYSMDYLVRIPTEKFEEFISSMEDAGKVITKRTSIENITRQYNDNTARIEALEIQEKRLLEMMEKAETIEEMLVVEQRLTDVQYQLNQAKTYQASMDGDVEYSTIKMDVEEVRRYQDHRESFLTRLGDSLTSGWGDFFDAMGNVVTGILYYMPYLIGVGVVIYFIKKKGIKLPKFGKKKEKSVEEES